MISKRPTHISGARIAESYALFRLWLSFSVGNHVKLVTTSLELLQEKIPLFLDKPEIPSIGEKALFGIREQPI